MLRRNSIFWFEFICFACLCFVLAAWPVSAGENICTLGGAQVIQATAFSVEIVISNSDTLAGFQIPFSFNYGEIFIACDSINFTGGDCRNFGFQDVKIDNQAKIAYLAAINNGTPEDSNPPLAPGQHSVARAYFSLERVDPGREVAFAISRYPNDKLDLSFLMWTPQAEEVEASFRFTALRVR